jgi:hypothetical protein
MAHKPCDYKSNCAYANEFSLYVEDLVVVIMRALVQMAVWTFQENEVENTFG